MTKVNFLGDTTLEAAQVQWEIWRRLTPDRRLKLACEMSDTLRRITASGVRSRHPEYSEEEVKLATIRLCLGDELFRQVYPNSKVTP